MHLKNKKRRKKRKKIILKKKVLIDSNNSKSFQFKVLRSILNDSSWYFRYDRVLFTFLKAIFRLVYSIFRKLAPWAHCAPLLICFWNSADCLRIGSFIPYRAHLNRLCSSIFVSNIVVQQDFFLTLHLFMTISFLQACWVLTQPKNVGIK